MDAGEYDTNTLLINNLDYIAYRIYEPIASQSSTYTFNASDVEDDLRNHGHLVYMDAIRRGIWCFYLAGKESFSTPHPEQLGLTAKMEICGYPLGLVDEGRFKPADLLKTQQPGAQSTHTPNSSSSSGSALEAPTRTGQLYNAASVTNGPGAMQDIKGYSSIPVREVHEFFITATLSSLTTSFCHEIRAIPLDHRSVLLPPQAFQSDDADLGQVLRTSALATFRVYLTATGSLVISLCVSLLQGLISSADALRSSILPAGPTVLAAPLGAFGAMQGIVDADNHAVETTFGQSPDTQISRLRPEPGDRFSLWKSTCSRLLQMRGMSPSLLDGCAWLNIHFSQRKPYEQSAGGRGTPLVNSGPTAPWPSVLCFRRPRLETMLCSGSEREQPGAGESTDPLEDARKWCRNEPERGVALDRRGKERVAEARNQVNGELRSQQTNSYSPLNPRRQSNGAAAAAGIMYPTPPDGVQQLGVTPSFDGPVLSPGNQPATAAMADLDAAMHHPVSAGEGFDDGWGATEPKREQPGTAFLEGEHLYGELAGNIFEDNQLTDADFNFFDEDPGGDFDLPGLGDMDSMLDLNMADNMPHIVDRPDHAIKVEDTNGGTRPPAPEFTKPELKHARSTLAEESRQLSNADNYNVNSAVGIKRHSSPFNPDTVYKRIRASFHIPTGRVQYPNSTKIRRESVFEKVDFDPSLSLTNKKYQESGPFNYAIPSVKDKDDKCPGSGSTLTVPTQSKKPRLPKDLPNHIGVLLSKIGGGYGSSPGGRDDVVSESDNSDWASEDGSLSELEGAPSSPAKSSVIKRRPDDDVISMAASFKDLENISTDSPGYGQIDLSRLSVPEVPELSLTKYFADPEPASLHPVGSDSDYITIAQILTEQAASGSLRLSPPQSSSELRDARRGLLNAIRYSVQGLVRALPRSLSGAAECQLRPFVEVQDRDPPAQSNRMQQRPGGQEIVRPSIYQITPPHLELRRYDSRLAVLPTAMPFWESLGLGPVQGSKDIISICVFPHTDGMRDSAATFVERLRSTYETLKLGTFDPLPAANGVADGLLPYFADQEITSPGLNHPRATSVLAENLMNLVQSLAASQLTEKNFVVFFVYSPEKPSSIVEACAAFFDLFENYKRAMLDRKRSILNDLVLQLVPLDLVSSDTSVAVLTPQDSVKLCLETYDRCTLFGGPMPAPAIKLEKALPRSIDFKVNTNPSPSLLQENSCIHIAYAQSVDNRWISVAWTDNRGDKQMTASYCLGRRNRPRSGQLPEVAREIWDTTVNDLISICKVHWRVIITKCGPMDQTEANMWTDLAQQNLNNAAVSLVLMTVDTNPSLQLIPPSLRIPLTTPAVFYTTPVSTPQANMMSPDQSGNPPTPHGPGQVNPTTPGGGDSGGPEADNSDSTILADLTDTTWGVVAGSRLNNSTSLTELNPAIASGYLVKRTGPKIEDALVAMEVNVVYTKSDPRVHEPLLREMLSYFRGLGTLARARGVTGQEDVRPWHVAAAEKAARALYMLM
ncbi:hypothetical protein OQA88_10169 [Cercophora sp. LCS_1]